MKYSQQQLLDIQKKYADMKRNVRLNNLKSKAIQSVLIDKQLPENLIDNRNTNDIENDAFAKKAVLNDLSNKLLPTNKVHSFQMKLAEDRTLEMFFIQNFPKVQQEARMYRFLDDKSLFSIVIRLYNRYIQEIELPDQLDRTEQFNQSIINLLQNINRELQTSKISNDIVRKRTQQLMAIEDTIQAGGDYESIALGLGFNSVKDFKDLIIDKSKIEDATTTIPELDNLDPKHFAFVLEQVLKGFFRPKVNPPTITNNKSVYNMTDNEIIAAYNWLEHSLTNHGKHGVSRKKFGQQLNEYDPNYNSYDIELEKKGSTKESVLEIFKKKTGIEERYNQILGMNNNSQTTLSTTLTPNPPQLPPNPVPQPPQQLQYDSKVGLNELRNKLFSAENQDSTFQQDVIDVLNKYKLLENKTPYKKFYTNKIAKYESDINNILRNYFP